MRKKFAAVGAIGVIGLAGVAVYAGVLGTLTAGTVGAGQVDLQASCATTATVGPGDATWDPTLPEAHGKGGTGNFAYSSVVVKFVPGDGLTCEGQSASVVVYNKAEGSTDILSRNASPHKALKEENEARTFTIPLDTKIMASVKHDDYRYGLIMQGPNPTSAPSNVVAVGSDQKMLVSWTAPSRLNGAPVTDYIVQYAVVEEPQGTLGAWTEFDHLPSAQKSIEIAGSGPLITNGTLNHVRVAAKISAGVSDWAQTQSPARAMTVPTPPRNVAGTHGDEKVHLTWQEPEYDGGTPITGYRILWWDVLGNVWSADVPPETSHTVEDLVNGRWYRFSVYAKNVAGMSQHSQDSGPIVPRTVPATPDPISMVVSGDRQLTLDFHRRG